MVSEDRAGRLESCVNVLTTEFPEGTLLSIKSLARLGAQAD